MRYLYACTSSVCARARHIAGRLFGNTKRGAVGVRCCKSRAVRSVCGAATTKTRFCASLTFQSFFLNRDDRKTAVEKKREGNLGTLSLWRQHERHTKKKLVRLLPLMGEGKEGERDAGVVAAWRAPDCPQCNDVLAAAGDPSWIRSASILLCRQTLVEHRFSRVMHESHERRLSPTLPFKELLQRASSRQRAARAPPLALARARPALRAKQARLSALNRCCSGLLLLQTTPP